MGVDGNRHQDEASGETAVGADPEDDPLESLHPSVVHLWRIESGIRAVFLTLLAAGIAAYFGNGIRPGFIAAAAAFIPFAAHAFFWPSLRYRHWGYRIRDADVFLRYGVLWKVTSVIPHRRLQHVDTERGPFERALGLSRVVIFTAGTRGSQTTIPGLSRDGATRLRDHLGRLGQGDDAV